MEKGAISFCPVAEEEHTLLVCDDNIKAHWEGSSSPNPISHNYFKQQSAMNKIASLFGKCILV